MSELLDCAMASKSVHNTPVTYFLLLLLLFLVLKSANLVDMYNGKSNS